MAIRLTPSHLPFLPRVWIDSDAAVWSGSNLTSLVDKGTEGGSFTKVGTPTKATAINGHTGINFANNGQQLTKVVNWGSSGKLFIFAVIKLSTSPTVDTGLLQNGQGLNASGTVTLHPSGADPDPQIYFAGNGYSGANAPNLTSVLTGGHFPSSSAHCGAFQLGTTNLIRSDGVTRTLTSSATGALPSYGSNTWKFGVNFGDESLQGDIHQLLMYDIHPTAQMIEQLEGWGMHLLALQSQLPSDHPAYHDAPRLPESSAPALLM